jgi:hypothetical protein
VLCGRARELCGGVVKIEFLMQKVEISVRESCVEVDKFARLTPATNTARCDNRQGLYKDMCGVDTQIYNSNQHQSRSVC